MKVGELKALLRDLNDDMPVLRGDNSGGYENVYGTVVKPVVDNFKRDDTENVVLILK